MAFAVVHNDKIRVPNPDAKYDFQYDADGIAIPGSEGWDRPDYFFEWDRRTTTYFDENADPFDPIVTREGNEIAVLVELYDHNGNYVITESHDFIVDGNYYRTDGPTSVSGDERIGLSAEYFYGDRHQDEALGIWLAQGRISQTEYDDAIEKYNNLPKEVDASNPLVKQLLGRSANHDLPFKDDCEFIVGLLDGGR